MSFKISSMTYIQCEKKYYHNVLFTQIWWFYCINRISLLFIFPKKHRSFYCNYLSLYIIPEPSTVLEEMEFETCDTTENNAAVYQGTLQ